MGLKGYQEPWGQCGKEDSREAFRGPDESHQPDGKSHLGQGAVLPSVLLRAEVGALGSPYDRYSFGDQRPGNERNPNVLVLMDCL